MTAPADDRAESPAFNTSPGSGDDTTRDRPNPQTPHSHEHTPEEERQIREAALDETIADSFPASDPPSSDPNPDNHEAMRPDGSGEG